jgi:hypothetical protein
MRTTTKLTLLVIVTVGMLTAVAMSTITSGGNLAYAKKKSCNETEEIICQTKTQSLSNEKYLLSNGNETATRSDHGENDSNIVDEQIRVDDSEIQVDNSTSPTTVLPSIPQPEDSPFSLPTM